MPNLPLLGGLALGSAFLGLIIMLGALCAAAVMMLVPSTRNPAVIRVAALTGLGLAFAAIGFALGQLGAQVLA